MNKLDISHNFYPAAATPPPIISQIHNFESLESFLIKEKIIDQAGLTQRNGFARDFSLHPLQLNAFLEIFSQNVEISLLNGAKVSRPLGNLLTSLLTYLHLPDQGLELIGSYARKVLGYTFVEAGLEALGIPVDKVMAPEMKIALKERMVGKPSDIDIRVFLPQEIFSTLNLEKNKKERDLLQTNINKFFCEEFGSPLADEINNIDAYRYKDYFLRIPLGSINGLPIEIMCVAAMGLTELLRREACGVKFNLSSLLNLSPLDLYATTREVNCFQVLLDILLNKASLQDPNVDVNKVAWPRLMLFKSKQGGTCEAEMEKKFLIASLFSISSLQKGEGLAKLLNKVADHDDFAGTVNLLIEARSSLALLESPLSKSPYTEMDLKALVENVLEKCPNSDPFIVSALKNYYVESEEAKIKIAVSCLESYHTSSLNREIWLKFFRCLLNPLKGFEKFFIANEINSEIWVKALILTPGWLSAGWKVYFAGNKEIPIEKFLAVSFKKNKIESLVLSFKYHKKLSLVALKVAEQQFSTLTGDQILTLPPEVYLFFYKVALPLSNSEKMQMLSKVEGRPIFFELGTLFEPLSNLEENVFKQYHKQFLVLSTLPRTYQIASRLILLVATKVKESEIELFLDLKVDDVTKTDLLIQEAGRLNNNPKAILEADQQLKSMDVAALDLKGLEKKIILLEYYPSKTLLVWQKFIKGLSPLKSDPSLLLKERLARSFAKYYLEDGEKANQLFGSFLDFCKTCNGKPLGYISRPENCLGWIQYEPKKKIDLAVSLMTTLLLFLEQCPKEIRRFTPLLMSILKLLPGEEWEIKALTIAFKSPTKLFFFDNLERAHELLIPSLFEQLVKFDNQDQSLLNEIEDFVKRSITEKQILVVWEVIKQNKELFDYLLINNHLTGMISHLHKEMYPEIEESFKRDPLLVACKAKGLDGFFKYKNNKKLLKNIVDEMIEESRKANFKKHQELFEILNCQRGSLNSEKDMVLLVNHLPHKFTIEVRNYVENLFHGLEPGVKISLIDTILKTGEARGQTSHWKWSIWSLKLFLASSDWYINGEDRQTKVVYATRLLLAYLKNFNIDNCDISYKSLFGNIFYKSVLDKNFDSTNIVEYIVDGIMRYSNVARHTDTDYFESITIEGCRFYSLPKDTRHHVKYFETLYSVLDVFVNELNTPSNKVNTKLHDEILKFASYHFLFSATELSKMGRELKIKYMQLFKRLYLTPLHDTNLKYYNIRNQRFKNIFDKFQAISFFRDINDSYFFDLCVNLSMNFLEIEDKPNVKLVILEKVKEAVLNAVSAMDKRPDVCAYYFHHILKIVARYNNSFFGEAFHLKRLNYLTLILEAFKKHAPNILKAPFKVKKLFEAVMPPEEKIGTITHAQHLLITQIPFDIYDIYLANIDRIAHFEDNQEKLLCSRGMVIQGILHEVEVDYYNENDEGCLEQYQKAISITQGIIFDSLLCNKARDLFSSRVFYLFFQLITLCDARFKRLHDASSFVEVRKNAFIEFFKQFLETKTYMDINEKIAILKLGMALASRSNLHELISLDIIAILKLHIGTQGTEEFFNPSSVPTQTCYLDD